MVSVAVAHYLASERARSESLSGLYQFPFVISPVSLRFYICASMFGSNMFRSPLFPLRRDLNVFSLLYFAGVSTPVTAAKPEEPPASVGPSKLARDDKRLYDGGTKVLHTGGIRKRRDSGSTSEDDGSPVKNREKRARGKDRGKMFPME